MNNDSISSPKKISVVMCTYNGEKYICEQLDSIVSQTYPIYELIILDDCSTDNTITIIQRYASQYSYIKLHQNKSNIGFNQNFKNAILKATGDYIAISDQDDIWYKDKLKKQILAIKEYSLCTTERHIDPSFQNNSMRQIVKPIITFEYLLFTNSIPGHSMLIEKKFAQETMLKWNNNCICYDWWIAINAHLSNGITCVNAPLNWHRPHSQSAITQHNKKYNKDRQTCKNGIQKLTWQPYVYGYKSYKKLQQLNSWIYLYTFIYQNTNTQKEHLIHVLSRLLINNDFISLIKLCLLCMKHKNKIIFFQKNSFMNYIRGFFIPFIRSYGNNNFYI